MNRKTHPRLAQLVTVVLLLSGMLLVGPPNPAGDALAGGSSGMKQDRQATRGVGFVSRALHHMLRHAKDLGVADEQQTTLRTIVHDYAQARIRGEADVKLAEVEVQTLVHDPRSELPAIEKAMRASAEAELALRVTGIKAFRAATGVLTPEQLEKWRALLRSGYGKTGKRSNPDEEEEKE